MDDLNNLQFRNVFEKEKSKEKHGISTKELVSSGIGKINNANYRTWMTYSHSHAFSCQGLRQASWPWGLVWVVKMWPFCRDEKRDKFLLLGN
jgi:hypothetical protein